MHTGLSDSVHQVLDPYSCLSSQPSPKQGLRFRNIGFETFQLYSNYRRINITETPTPLHPQCQRDLAGWQKSSLKHLSFFNFMCTEDKWLSVKYCTSKLEFISFYSTQARNLSKMLLNDHTLCCQFDPCRMCPSQRKYPFCLSREVKV